MTRQEIHINSEDKMTALGQKIALQLKAGIPLTLTGEMGAGKSVLARAIIRTLMGEEVDVPSPTYTLVQHYDAQVGTIYHFDLYRLEDAEEVLALDWDAAMHDGICLIEWPNKAGAYLPRNYISIAIEKSGDQHRKVSCNSNDISFT